MNQESDDKSMQYDQDNLDLNLRKGKEVMKIGEFKQALDIFNHLIERNPKNIELRRIKAITLERLGEFEKAIECYAECIELNPNDFEHYKQKARLLLKIGKYQETTECYDIYLELNPQSCDCLKLKGQLLQIQMKYTEALDLFNQCIIIDKDDFENYQYKVEVLLTQAKQQESLECLDEYIKLKQNILIGYQKKADLLLILKKEQQALECLDEYIKLNPHFLIGYQKKAQILYRRPFNFSQDNHWSKFSEALLCLHQYNQSNPNKIDAYFSINKEDITIEAIKCFNECIKIDPDNYLGYYGKGVALKKLEQYQDVLVLSDECIQKFPDVQQFYILKAKVFEDTYKNDEETLEIYDQYLQINPNNAEFYILKALYLNNTFNNFTENAIDCIDKCFSLDPSNYKFYKKFIDSLEKERQIDERVKIYDKFIKLNPNSFQVYLDKANDLRYTCQIFEGIECLRICIEMNPDIYIDYQLQHDILRKTMYEYEADMYVKQYVKRHPYNKQAWLDYATLINYESSDYINRQQYQVQESHLEEAIRANNECIQLNPTNFEGYKGIAFALILKGKDQEAQKIFKENLQFYPLIDNYYNQEKFVKLLIQMRLFLEATQIIEKLYKNNPKDRTTIFYKAQILMGLKNYQQAIVYYRMYYSGFSKPSLKNIYQML